MDTNYSTSTCTNETRITQIIVLCNDPRVVVHPDRLEFCFRKPRYTHCGAEIVLKAARQFVTIFYPRDKDSREEWDRRGVTAAAAGKERVVSVFSHLAASPAAASGGGGENPAISPINLTIGHTFKYGL